jgi:ribosomal protein L37AE/L43A
MKILFNTKECPRCHNRIHQDFKTGPGKWYWCEKCGHFTIHPYSNLNSSPAHSAHIKRSKENQYYDVQ